MLKELTKGLLFTLACIILSCLMSIMALFISGGQNGSDLQMLMQTQILAIPLGAIITVWTIVSVGGGTFGYRLKKLYAATPQWLVFSAAMLNLLVAFGEIALITVSIVSDEKILWTDHVALVSMMMSSLAFCLLYGHGQLMSGQTHALSGRWGP